MKVGICAIIKDCPTNYFREWLEWHRLIGVDHFFIYDNSSAIPIAELTKDSPDVVVFLWEGDCQQMPVYNDCIAKQRKGELPKCDWIAFIDDDEFIFVKSGNIKRFLVTQKDSGVGLNWMVFGNSDTPNRRESLIYTHTKVIPQEASLRECYQIKSIVRPERVKKFTNPHYAIYSSGACRDTTGGIVKRFASENIHYDYAWINHYHCQTEEDYKRRIKRGRADSPKNIYNMDRFFYFDAKATATNYEMIHMFQKLKYPKIARMRPPALVKGLEDLIRYIQKEKDTSQMIMIEIGSYAGESTAVFAKHFKKVIAVDPYLDNYDPKEGVCRKRMASFDRVLEAFKERMVLFDNIELCRKAANDAVLQLPGVDFVYIDGDHRYENVCDDITNYLPKINPGGFMGGHDYGYALPGVKKAVDEIFKKPDVTFSDTSWIKYVQKKERPIALLTATGGRLEQIKLCANFMKAQNYKKEVIWIITDDCLPITSDFIKDDFRENWKIVHLYPAPSWKVGENTQARNLQVGIDEVKKHSVSGIFIIEDDDYYSPNYLSVMVAGLNGFDVIGEIKTLYYHTGMRRSHRHKNEKHSSLFQTGFTERMLPVFEELLKSEERFLDICFFKEAENIQFFKGLDLAVGIKGLPGRKGIGKGHDIGFYRGRPDVTPKRLRKVLERIYGDLRESKDG